MIKIRIVLFLLMLVFMNQAFSAQISIVSVSSKGFGETEADAISDAVVNGVAQVNGESIASSMRIKKKVVSSSNQATAAERTIEKDLARSTKGIVKSWQKISTFPSAGGYAANVEVSVVVLKRSVQLKRMKLAIVAYSPTADDLTGRMVDDLTEFLTSSRKFAVMDRNRGEVIQNQLDRIRNGSGAVEDKARLSAEVAPDFIAVVTLKIVPSSGKQIAEASLEIIDYSTRQIKFNEKKSLSITSSESALVNKRIKLLSKNLSRSVIETVYPPIVVALSEDGLITIAQGSDFFSIGDKCVIKEINGKVKDPHTKEFLGYIQTEVGTAEIVFSDKRLSQARLGSGMQLSAEKIAGQKYIVGRSGEALDDVFKLLESSNDNAQLDAGSQQSARPDDDY